MKKNEKIVMSFEGKEGEEDEVIFSGTLEDLEKQIKESNDLLGHITDMDEYFRKLKVLNETRKERRKWEEALSKYDKKGHK